MFGKTTHPLVWTSLKLFHFVYSSLRYVTKMFCVLIWTWSFQNNIGKGKVTRFISSIKSWTGSFERACLESNGYEIHQNAKWRCQVRDVTKISICLVNTTSRWGIKQLGIFLVLFFFYFPMKVAGGHNHSSRGNPWPSALNDSPVPRYRLWYQSCVMPLSLHLLSWLLLKLPYHWTLSLVFSIKQTIFWYTHLTCGNPLPVSIVFSHILFTGKCFQ